MLRSLTIFLVGLFSLVLVLLLGFYLGRETYERRDETSTSHAQRPITKPASGQYIHPRDRPGWIWIEHAIEDHGFSREQLHAFFKAGLINREGPPFTFYFYEQDLVRTKEQVTKERARGTVGPFLSALQAAEEAAKKK